MKKSKSVVLCALFLFSISTAFAQQWKKQPSALEFRVGVLPTFAKDDGAVRLLPLSINYTRRVAEKISLGAFYGYSITETDRQEISDGSVAQWRNRFSAYGLRVAAHTNKFEDWDVYGGFMLGYNHTRLETLSGDVDDITKHMGLQESSGSVTLTGFIGGRYAFTKQIGITGELGFGVSIANLGISYRF